MCSNYDGVKWKTTQFQGYTQIYHFGWRMDCLLHGKWVSMCQQYQCFHEILIKRYSIDPPVRQMHSVILCAAGDTSNGGIHVLITYFQL